MFFSKKSKKSFAIAVVGYSGRFPGATNTEEFWNNLKAGKNSISNIPIQRWGLDDYLSENKIVTKKGGFIEDVDLFDGEYFGLSESRATLLAPQSRLLLEVVAETVNHAGYRKDELKGTKTGVFAAVEQGDYGLTSTNTEPLKFSNTVYDDKNGIIGNVYPNIAANIISKQFDFKGPSFTLTSACSSSLVAIHLACQSLTNKETDFAIAGAAQLHLSPFPFICASRVGVLSPEANTFTFSEKANGYALSEGVGVVLLRRLDDAVRDGDNIHGVIRSSAVNNDGKTMSILMANPDAQRKVILEALNKADIVANSVSYMEANGTAMPLGDPIEVKAATDAFRKSTTSSQFCAIGSLEPNVGHMVNASGIGRFLKVILSLREKKIPPFIYADEENPKIDFKNSPFYTNDKLINWQPINGRRRAVINAFGFGGTNCSIVLDEYNPRNASKYHVKRTLLPKIEFNKKRLWYTDISDVKDIDSGLLSSITEAVSSRAKLHPLLHENTSILTEQRFSSIFNGDEFFLTDHRVNIDGQPTCTLPGVAYLEMALSAVKYSVENFNSRGLAITNIAWVQPFCPQNSNNKLSIRLFENSHETVALDGAEISFEIYSQIIGSTDVGSQLHAQGAIIINNSVAKEPVKDTVEPLGYIQGRYTGNQCYRVFQELGMHYGLAHQGLVEVIKYTKDNDYPIVSADISLQQSALNAKDEYILHPGILDSALQATICLTQDMDLLLLDPKPSTPPALPFAIERFEFYRPLTSRVKAIARYQESGCSYSDVKMNLIQKMDIDLFDDNGEICVRIKGFSTRSNKIPKTELVKIENGKNLNLQHNEQLTSITTESDLIESTNSYLKSIFLPIMEVDGEYLETDISLDNYDIDSIKIIELNSKLETIFGSLSKTLLFEYKSINELAHYFVDNHYTQLVCLLSNVDSLSAYTKENISDNPNSPVTVSASSKAVQTGDQSLDYSAWSRRRTAPQISSNLSLNPEIENKQSDEPIAIIGISGRYPQAETLDHYWENLKSGKDCVSEIPSERWSIDGFFVEDPKEAVEQAMSYSKWGAFIESFANFDPLFFNISPREAINIDPQERLFLQTCWELFEDAGYTREKLEKQHKRRVGVFAGITKTGFDLYGPDLWRKDEKIFPRSSFPSVANRVSYFFNLSGPSYPVDTMCSSSLTAIHEACAHLHRNECELAIAGGVNLYLHPANYVALCSGYMLSRDGQCKSFGEGGNGFVPGEGVGAVLLKPLSRAIADKDQIHGIVRGSSVNHGGKTNGYTVPNPIAQAELVKVATERAGISARDISYIEAHGTGTELGDPIEFSGLTQAFRATTQDIGFCALGSVKSNIGHLEAAAGMAGLTKIIMQMKHKKLVASLHSKELNTNIDFDNSPFVVNQTLKDWSCHGATRIAGISSFGAGGANAHVILEEYLGDSLSSSESIQQPAIILLSAKNIDRLHAVIARFQQFINQYTNQELQSSSINLYDVAYTLQIGREHMEQRFAVIVNSFEELELELENYLKNQGNAFTGCVQNKDASVMAFKSDKDAEQLLSLWLQKKKFQKLLPLWVKGVDIDWQSMYLSARNIVSLPTYPFQQDKYWFTQQTIWKKSRAQTGPTNICSTKSDNQKMAINEESVTETLVGSEITKSSSGFNLMKYLVKLIAKHLKLKESLVEPDRDLDEYGLDSIVSVRILDEISILFQDISRSLFLEHANISRISDHITTHHADEVARLLESAGSENRTKIRKTVPVTNVSNQTDTKVLLYPEDVVVKKNHISDVSIIGLSGLLPNVNNMDEFWSKLSAGLELTTKVCDRRLKLMGVPHEDIKSSQGYIGGYIDDVEYFDHDLFKIPLEEAKSLDPQFRKLLEVSWKAIYDAGYTLNSFKKRSTGIFVAVNGGSGYSEIKKNISLISSEVGDVPVELLSSYPNRISNILDLSGPSEVVETGCSSFLVAIRNAVSALRQNRCEQAIVATSELILKPLNSKIDDPLGIYSRQNTTKSFSDDSDGYVKSESVGAVVLKASDLAQQHGDPSYMTIKGIGVCHGGKAPLKWYSPNIKGQILAINEAFADAKIEASSIDCIEPEANGSMLGDASEVIAIQKAYGDHIDAGELKKGQQTSNSTIFMSSLKPQVGHAEAASTFPVLVKMIYAMKHGEMLKVKGLNELNSGITIEPGFDVLSENRPWKQRKKNGNLVPRRAAIHSMSIGGVNAHLLVEQVQHNSVSSSHELSYLFVFSDRSEIQLRSMIRKYIRFFERNEAISLLQLDYTLKTAREMYGTRLAVIAYSVDELSKELLCWLQNKEANVYTIKSVNPTSQFGKPTKEIVNNWFKENDLDSIANAWVSGTRIDWSSMYRDLTIERLNLPTNSLKKTYCWHNGIEEPQLVNSSHNEIGVLSLQPVWKPKPIIVRSDFNQFSPTHVVFLDWSSEHFHRFKKSIPGDIMITMLNETASSIADCFISYAKEIFELIKDLLSAKPKQPINLQVVVPGCVDRIYLQGIAGLLKTARQESSKLIGQLVVTDIDTSAERMSEIVEENRHSSQDAYIQYSKNRRQVQTWSIIDSSILTSLEHNSSPIYKENGTYLVTGGLGSLGYIFAKDIAKQTNYVRIILTGRSELSSEKGELLNKLNDLGADAIYVRSDVTDKGQIKQLIMSVTNQYGGLAGIIHSSGIIKDSLIVRKTTDELEEVMSPKVLGLYYLDKATCNLDLDFFILFSSLSGAFGNAGQADYSMSNAFMDCYAHYRNSLVLEGKRKGKTMSVNWPLWKDGGMNIDDSIKAFLKKKHHIQPLPTDDGIRALNIGIQGKLSQFAIQYGDIAKMKERIDH